MLADSLNNTKRAALAIMAESNLTLTVAAFRWKAKVCYLNLCNTLSTATLAHSFKKNTQVGLYSCPRALVNISAINSKQPKGRSNVKWSNQSMTSELVSCNSCHYSKFVWERVCVWVKNQLQEDTPRENLHATALKAHKAAEDWVNFLSEKSQVTQVSCCINR